jgi:hypothetical protein
VILRTRIPAGRYERFGPSAAESLPGQDFTAKIENAPVGVGKIVEAEVVEGGAAIEITVEWPGELLGLMGAT